MEIKPLIFGFSGPRLANEEKEFFLKNPIQGFILFKRNIENKKQLKDLVNVLKSLYVYKTLVFIDQEGGRVARLIPPIISKAYPPAAKFGEIYDLHGAKKGCSKVFKNYFDLMKELKDYKVDSICAPVVDLRYSYTDNIIGDRSFGSEVQKVVDLSTWAIKGIIKAEGIPIIKHIPGHGRTICDSHYELPVIDTPLAQLKETDFAVFTQISRKQQEEGLSVWAMTAHVQYRCLDSVFPVTLSKKAIDSIREEIGFKSILITDDICMHALHQENCTPYFLIKQLLQLIKNRKAQEAKYKKILAELIRYNAIEKELEPLELQEQLAKILPEFKAKFVENICKVALQSKAAGCNIVLHCNGDLQEMQAICKVI